jgi:hypothetical protein
MQIAENVIKTNDDGRQAGTRCISAELNWKRAFSSHYTFRIVKAAVCSRQYRCHGPLLNNRAQKLSGRMRASWQLFGD